MHLCLHLCSCIKTLSTSCQHCQANCASRQGRQHISYQPSMSAWVCQPDCQQPQTDCQGRQHLPYLKHVSMGQRCQHECQQLSTNCQGRQHLSYQQSMSAWVSTVSLNVNSCQPTVKAVSTYPILSTEPVSTRQHCQQQSTSCQGRFG